MFVSSFIYGRLSNTLETRYNCKFYIGHLLYFERLALMQNLLKTRQLTYYKKAPLGPCFNFRTLLKLLSYQ